MLKIKIIKKEVKMIKNKMFKNKMFKKLQLKLIHNIYLSNT